jgi:hypothetical protein
MLDCILQTFGVIKGIKSSAESKLITKLWEILGGKEKGEILYSDLKSAIASIFDVQGDNNYNGQEMHQEFLLLYLNKMSQRPQSKEEESYSHKPLLSAKTIMLAEKSRGKRNDLIRHSFSQNELKEYEKMKNNLPHILKQIKKVKDNQCAVQRDKKIIEEQKKCTFQPNLERRNGVMKSPNKCLTLYKLSKTIKKKVKRLYISFIAEHHN